MGLVGEDFRRPTIAMEAELWATERGNHGMEVPLPMAFSLGYHDSALIRFIDEVVYNVHVMGHLPTESWNCQSNSEGLF